MKTSLALSLFFCGFFVACGPVRAQEYGARAMPRPKAGAVYKTREDVLKLVPEHLHKESVMLVAIRYHFAREEGYGRNRFNSAFIVLRGDEVHLFPGNTLPSSYGFNKKVGKYFPTLMPGCYAVRSGTYMSPVTGLSKPAWRQASVMDVVRDNQVVERQKWLGIHIHAAGADESPPGKDGTAARSYPTSTGSWGCGTLRPAHFQRLYALVKPGTVVPYVVVECE